MFKQHINYTFDQTTFFQAPRWPKAELAAMIWTVTVLAWTLLVVVRFNVFTSGPIKRIYIGAEWSRTNTHIEPPYYLVTANRLNCGSRDCTVAINGQELRVTPYRAVAHRPCAASLAGEPIYCQHNSFRRSQTDQEPEIYIEASIEKSGWFANAVPLWMYHWASAIALFGISSLPVAWYAVWLTNVWPTWRSRTVVYKALTLSVTLVLLASVVMVTWLVTFFGILSVIGMDS